MFCVSCGKQNREGARFCHSCGEELKTVGGTACTAPPSGAVIPQRRRPKRSIIPILLSLLLTAFAISQMTLGISGAITTGVVTDIQPRIHVGPGQDAGNTHDLTRYEMFYQFTASDSKEYSGSATKSFPYGVRAASDGTPRIVTVRYLPMMPHINAPDGETNILPGVLLLVLASLLFLIGIKGSVSFGYKKRW